MAKARIGTFILREKNGKETGVFTGKQLRQIALKAANCIKGTEAKPIEIKLRERGTKKVQYPDKFLSSINHLKALELHVPDIQCIIPTSQIILLVA